MKHPAWGLSHSVRDYELAKELAATDRVTVDDDVARLLPALLFLHAGSFHGGDKASRVSVDWCRELAQAGYAVVAADYSLGSGPAPADRWSAWPQSLLDCLTRVARSRWPRRILMSGNGQCSLSVHIGVSPAGFSSS
jgi:acetyl esterase/lipase